MPLIGIAGSASAHHWVADIGWSIVFALSAAWEPRSGIPPVRYLSKHHAPPAKTF